MNTKKILQTILLILILVSCSSIKQIPEISENHTLSLIYTSPQERGEIIGLCQWSDYLYILHKNALISRINENKIIDGSYHLKKKFEKNFFHDNNLILLRYKNSKAICIFDLDKMSIVQEINKVPKGEINIFDRSLIALKSKNKILFYNYIKELPTVSVTLKNDIYFNTDLNKNVIIILTQNHIYIINRADNQIKTINLKYKATSNFFLDEDKIYYGNSNRELVAYSWKTFKTLWRYKLPRVLTTKPVVHKNYITVAPKDNNIYFFTIKGEMEWWKPLNATKKYGPILTNNNAAVVMLPEAVDDYPYINLYNIKNKKELIIKTNRPVKDTPIFFKSSISFITGKELKTKEQNNTSNKNKIFYSNQKEAVAYVKNIYDINIKTTPENIYDINKTIRFDINPINLINTEIQVAIYNKNGELIYSHYLKKKEKYFFSWLAQKEGIYTINFIVYSKNQPNFEKNIQITVYDLYKKNIEHKLRKLEELKENYL